MRTFLISITTVLFLSACGSYGVSYPKPNYKYAETTNDPEIFFESDFSTDTQFLVKTGDIKDARKCLTNAKRVAYLQDMDSYFRHADAPGPWKIAAPASQPILVAGSWFTYGSETSSTMNGLTTKTIIRGRSCKPVIKIFTPKAGEEYLVRLTNAGQFACSLSITHKDGSPVETTDALACQNN